VAVLEGEQQLIGDFPDDFLSNRMLLILFALFEVSTQIASRAVLHDDEHFCCLLVHDPVLVFDNIGVFEFFEDVHLGHKLLFLATGHPVKVDLFPDKNLVVGYSSDFPDNAERSLADLFERLVFLHQFKYNCQSERCQI